MRGEGCVWAYLLFHCLQLYPDCEMTGIRSSTPMSKVFVLNQNQVD